MVVSVKNMTQSWEDFLLKLRPYRELFFTFVVGKLLQDIVETGEKHIDRLDSADAYQLKMCLGKDWKEKILGAMEG